MKKKQSWSTKAQQQIKLLFTRIYVSLTLQELLLENIVTLAIVSQNCRTRKQWK